MKEKFFDLQRFTTTTSTLNDGEAVVEESKSIFKKLSEYVPSGLKFYSFIAKFLEHLKIAQSGFPITTDHNHLWYVLSKFNEIGTITITSLKTGKLSLSSGLAIKNKFSEAISDLTKLTATKDPLPFMLVIAMSMHLKNIIGTLDGHELSDKEKKDLNLSFANVTKESIKLLAKIMNAETKLTMPLGIVDFVVSIVTGAISGIFQAMESSEKYSEDGLPDDLALKEIIIDVIVTSIHEFNTTLTGGADDVAFKFLQWAISLIPGIETSDKNKNYMEWIGEVFKQFNIKNRGDSGDNILVSEENDTVVYGDDGNDYMRNFASNVQLIGGHDDDTIFSHKGAQKNSILGSPGNDFILAYDNKSTIYGCANNDNYDGDDNDKIAVYGNKNKIYGEFGNDVIFLTNDANDNTINGGLGDDIIILDNSKNSVIEYNDGDGNDVVYFYSENDKLQIHGNYSTQVSGKSVYINVGEGRIVLDNAVGLIIDINGKKISTANDSTSGNDALTPIEFPSFWEDNVYITRGTAKNDEISNDRAWRIINTGDGNDLIHNYSNKVTIQSGNDDDTIVNHSSNIVSINGGNGNDKIFNGGYYDGSRRNNWCEGGSSLTIDGGAGNDSIEDWGFFVVYKGKYDYYSNRYSKITGGEGDDYIRSDSMYSTLYGGNGNDTIDSDAGYSSIYGGNGNDSIKSTSMAMIDAGDGNDTINNEKDTHSTILGGDGDDFINSKTTGDYYIGNLIDGGEGNDTINNIGKNATIYSGLGDDSIYNSSDSVTIDGGDGSDTIENSDSSVTINGGKGDDYISNNNDGDNVTIDGGVGNDYIYSGGSNVTITGGAGSDSIFNNCYEYDGSIHYSPDSLGYGKNLLIKYSSGDGNDIIYGFKADSTLQIGDGSGTYSTTKSDSDIIITVGDGKITLVGSASLSSLKIDGIEVNPKDVRGTAIADSIINSIEGATIQAFDGDNKITNIGMNVSIIAGTGKDYIINSADNVTISSGSGNDSIENATNRNRDAKNVSILSGAGNDFIKNKANGLNSRIFSGADDDKVVNYGLSSTIDGGSGNDELCNYSKSVSINGGVGNDSIYNSGSYSTLKGEAGNDSIRNDFGKNILVDSGSGNDTVNNLSGESATIDGGEGDDYIYNSGLSVSIDGGEGNDYIYIYTNALKNTINAGKGNDTVENSCTDGVLFQYISGDGYDSIKGFTAKDTLSISGSNYSTQKSGDDVFVKVGEASITLESAGKLSKLNIVGNSTALTLLTVTNSTSSPVTIGSAIKAVDASTRTKAVKITGNSLTNTISGGSKNDSIYGGAGDDSVVGNAGNDKLYGEDGADTLWGGKGNDTLTGGNGSDIFIYNAGKDVITDYATGDKISLSTAISKASISGSDVIFTIGKGSLIVKDGTDKNITVVDKNGNESVKKYSTKLTVTNKTKSPVTVGSAIKTIDASKRTKAVKITGNALANSILGGTGADTLYGGKGNDTLMGGKGKDVFIYKSGKDTITDYASGDKISLGAAVSKSSVKGSDVIFTIGSGSLIVKNGKGKSLAMIDSKGKSFSTILGGATTLSVTDKTKSPVTVGSAVKTVNASKRTTAVKITGNALANTINGGSSKDSIYGGSGNDSILGNKGNDKLYGQGGNDILKGGAGNDSLWGGAGNDTLWGDAGKDTFIYANGDGKDIIYGFENNDMLKITGTFSASYNKSKKEIAFKVGSTASAITLKDFGSTSSFNINGTNYKISGTKLVKK